VEPQQTLKSWNVEFNSKNCRLSSPSWHCGSANQNIQLHNMIPHGIITHQTISHFTVPPAHQTVSTVNKHRIWWKGPPSMISHKSCNPTNVAGMSQMTWPNNPYKLPE
jgi:hypothetical protein